MERQEIEELVWGEHGNPFSRLGAHRLGSTGEWVIRALVPGATHVELRLFDGESSSLLPMASQHPEGLFEVEVQQPGDMPPGYHLRCHWGDHVQERIDPYSFRELLSEFDLHLLGEGTHFHSYRRMGAHLERRHGVDGVRFAVWAPNARAVSVVGDFNDWNTRSHPMDLHHSTGIWQLFVPGVQEGAHYKYLVRFHSGGAQEKIDPYGFHFETPPKTAGRVFDLDRYRWQDEEWMTRRRQSNPLESPVAIYEVHLGSWKKLLEEDNRSLTYRELAEELIPWVKELGFTHLELLPITEHPYTRSWGYQTTGYFAPTSRFGNPDDFRDFVDRCHQNGLGVLLDWVPAHFPRDAHALANFDGTQLYEHSDPRRGAHPDWGTLIFNYGRNEVKNFLLSSALFWLDEYHLDGLRVDAVASMLYLDYSREGEEWLPNKYGGRENLEAIDFLRRFNELVYEYHPGAITMAEESTAWPSVSRPTYLGGLGFSMKWNMGWMHDSLAYIGMDSIYRRYHHEKLTFSMLYAFSENYILPLSHDEVVHGKRSLLDKQPGDVWQKFANLRCYYTYWLGHPGKKLLFMGGEIGQWWEWNAEAGLDWHLLGWDNHEKLRRFVAEILQLYRSQPALYEVDFSWEGFQWVGFQDHDQSVISFVRLAKDSRDFLVFVYNFTPIVRHDYRIGVPEEGFYREILNSDAESWGGSNVGNLGGRPTDPIPDHGHQFSLGLTLPPLGALILKLEREGEGEGEAAAEAGEEA